MSLIASDFSYLPDVKIPGERAPLVSTKVCSFSYCNYFQGLCLVIIFTALFLMYLRYVRINVAHFEI
jgi:hypothetical protein